MLEKAAVPERRQGDRRLRRLLIQVYVLYGVVLAVFVFTAAKLDGAQSDTRSVAVQLNHSVCTWRSDLQRRYQTTAEFLRDNPAGFPGVPLKTLTDGQRNLRRTIKSFRGLSCPK